MLSQAERRAKIGAVVRVSSGNFIEMYDFMVYGYYAKYIGDTFFPSKDAFASLMLSLVTFGAGYLMRPLGALVLGAYIDHHGRRAGLLLTLALMAVGTLTVAFTPGYAALGLAAPLIVVAGRLLQGLSAGVELGGVSVYLAEIATPGNRGFYCAWQSASQQVAVMFAALLGVALSLLVPPATMSVWGWRVPLIIGCLIIPLIFWFRSSLEETEVFKRRSVRHSQADILRLVAANWRVVATGMMMSVFTTTAFYLITAYTPTFGKQALHLSALGVMLVTLAVGASNFIWLPVGGAISDRIGRSFLLYAVPIAGVASGYPVMNWLVADPSAVKLLAAELWISALFGLYNGAMIPRLAEIAPPEVRTAAFALAFSLATAIFGGFTPAIATYLIHVTGDRAAPALWLSLAALISLAGVFLSRNQGVSRHADFAGELPADPIQSAPAVL
jgi:MFS family permease